VKKGPAGIIMPNDAAAGANAFVSCLTYSACSISMVRAAPLYCRAAPLSALAAAHARNRATAGGIACCCAARCSLCADGPQPGLTRAPPLLCTLVASRCWQTRPCCPRCVRAPVGSRCVRAQPAVCPSDSSQVLF
jgi:hypothetical protein